MVALRKKPFWILMFILLFNFAAVMNIETGNAQVTKLYVDPSEIKNSSLGIGSPFSIDFNIF